MPLAVAATASSPWSTSSSLLLLPTFDVAPVSVSIVVAVVVAVAAAAAAAAAAAVAGALLLRSN